MSTDDRRDTAMQAGHFDDPIQVSLLRAALCRTIAGAGDAGLVRTELAPAVQRAPRLSLREGARVRASAREDIEARDGNEEESDRAVREVLALRPYADLRAEWRITAPIWSRPDSCRSSTPTPTRCTPTKSSGLGATRSSPQRSPLRAARSPGSLVRPRACGGAQNLRRRAFATTPETADVHAAPIDLLEVFQIGGFNGAVMECGTDLGPDVVPQIPVSALRRKGRDRGEATTRASVASPGRQRPGGCPTPSSSTSSPRPPAPSPTSTSGAHRPGHRGRAQEARGPLPQR